MNTPFNLNELPAADMKKLGLIDANDDYTIEQEDIDAMLAGRLTRLLNLKNLDANDFRIDQIDTKISLYRETDGKVGFRLHPIYKEPVIPYLLDDNEAQALISGERTSIDKLIPGAGKKEIVFEYDPETRAFISYEPSRIVAPDKINGYKLKDWQKDDFKKGVTVELPDGTEVQHRASDPKGVLSDRAALIFSVLIDGGISYLLLRGIKHLMNSNKQQADENSPAFKKAYAEMEKHFAKKFQSGQEQTEDNRGYTKTRAR